jgi:NADPH-dependent ferric siderophore reductase
MEMGTRKMERSVLRVRHELKRRVLQVRQVERVTPNYVRITLGGEDLAGYTSLGYDDHSKLFFPADGGAEPAMRDYTPRRYDAVRGELQFEFALHGEGPASEWAAQVQVGQSLTVGGPRGSFVVEGDFDWYLLVGDETALPAIGRRLEELPANAKCVVVVEVANAAEELKLAAPKDTMVQWVHRDAGQGLLAAVEALKFPAGEPYAFVAAEGGLAKDIRRHLLEVRGLDKKWLKASGYWRKGAVAVHDNLED